MTTINLENGKTVKVVSASDSDYDNYDKTVSYDDKWRK